MKKIFLFAALAISIITSAQNNYLPSITPPSPESFNMTKYGEVGIDEFNGKVNLDIPIYNYVAGQLNVPINLTYYGAGVKVKDIPTKTGINWTLSAGGVISREIRDIMDEEAYYLNKRINIDATQIYNLNANSDCTNGAAVLRQFVDGDKDTEADVFRFNFLGNSGSFYLDDNMQPKLIKNDNNLKIEIDGNLFLDKKFIITDVNGIKYYFGGNNFIENSSTETFVGSERTVNAGGVSSFHLNRIAHPVSGNIFIEYEISQFSRLVMGENYNRTKSTQIDGAEIDCPAISAFENTGSSNVINLTEEKIIKKIYSTNNDEIVLFNNEGINGTNSRYVLNSIEVKKANVLTSKINFEYLRLGNPDNIKRFFLTKVSINKDLQLTNLSSKKYQEYIMEYNSPEELPDRFSKKIDALGYFNNINNQTLIPCFPGTVQTYPGMCPDRSSNFEFASKGVLKKIIYPTGGFSEFIYEHEPLVEKKFKRITGTTYINSSESFDDEGQFINGAYQKTHEELPKIVTDFNGVQSTMFEMPILYTQNVNIAFNCSTINNFPNRNATANLKIIDITDALNPITTTFTPSTPNITYNFVKNHIYKIILDLFPPTVTQEGYHVNCDFNFDLHVGYHAPIGNGVRIQKIKTYNSSSEPPFIKRYYYKAFNNINDIFADNREIKPSISNNAKLAFCYTGGAGLTEIPVYSTTISSESQMYDFTFSYFKPRDYSIVTISYGGDDFEQGGIEKKFLIGEESYLETLFPITTGPINRNSINNPEPKNNGFSLDGTLLKEKTFKNQNGIIYKINETNHTYEYPVENTKKNLFGYKIHDYGVYNNVYNNLHSITIPYDHNGWFDPLNPVFTNRCNCHSYDGIEPFMVDSMWQSIQSLGNQVIIDNYWSYISTGQYDIIYSFNAVNPTQVGITLREKIGTCSDANTLSNYFISLYTLSTYNFKKIQQEDVNYIDPIPANLVVYEPTEFDDPSIIYPTQTELEASFKKIVTTQNYEYGALKGLPTVVTTNTSDSAVVNKTVNTYVNTASSLPSIPSNQSPIYTSLISQNRVGSPVQVQQFKNAELLSTQRTLFNDFTVNSLSKILPEKIQVSKGEQPLEDKAIFYNYDEHFNPVVMGYEDAPKTRYMFNTEGLVVAKIENYTGTSTTFPLITGNIDNSSCALQTEYPNGNVTVFKYNLITKKLIQTTDARCQNTFYEYDDLQRLKLIKDHDGNIVKEFDQQFKPQD